MILLSSRKAGGCDPPPGLAPCIYSYLICWSQTMEPIMGPEHQPPPGPGRRRAPVQWRHDRLQC